MNLLELFSGTGSVGRIARDLGFNVISLDLKNADTNTDILKWDYRQFDRNHFDFTWSSPPPTQKRTKHTHTPKSRREGNPKGQPNDPPKHTHTPKREGFRTSARPKMKSSVIPAQWAMETKQKISQKQTAQLTALNTFFSHHRLNCCL